MPTCLYAGTNPGHKSSRCDGMDNLRIVYQSLPRLIRPQLVYAGNEARQIMPKNWAVRTSAARNIQARTDADRSRRPERNVGAVRLRPATAAQGLAELEQDWECEALPPATRRACRAAEAASCRMIERMNHGARRPWRWTWAVIPTIVLAAQGKTLSAPSAILPSQEQVGLKRPAAVPRCPSTQSGRSLPCSTKSC